MSDEHDPTRPLSALDSAPADSSPADTLELKRTTEELRLANAELQTVAEEMNRARQLAEQRADELAALNRMAMALTNVTDLRASLQMVARELTQVFNTRGSTVTLIDESGESAAVVAEYFNDPSLPSVLGLSVPLDTPAWERLDRERSAIVIERPGDDTLLGVVRDVMRERKVAQLLVAPLLSRGVLIGNMSVSHEPGRSFATHEVMLAETLAGPVAQAVENARLYKAAQQARETAEAVSRELETANRKLAQLSVTDALTGIPNRRRFHEVIESEWRRAQRNRESIAVMMIDVDFFKSYNDRYGHQRGDACLTRVAAALHDGLHRAGDFVGRYGGEEFVVILPSTNEETAGLQGQRLCERVRALDIAHETSAAASMVTISIGCAATIPAPNTTPATLIAAADHALYEAKRSGRNRVRCAGFADSSATVPPQ